MTIDPQTLREAATPLLAQIADRRAQHLDYTDLAFQALGMLQRFVEGDHDDEEPRTGACGPPIRRDRMSVV